MAKKKKPLTNKDILDTATREERCFLIGAFYALGCAKESTVDSGLTIRKEFIDMIEWYIKRNIICIVPIKDIEKREMFNIEKEKK